MKNVITPLLKVTAGTALVAGLIFSSACSKTRDTTASNSSSGTSSSSASTADNTTTATPTSSATTPTTGSASGAMANNGTAAAMTASDSWDNLKGYSYDQRSDFAAKATEYANRLDARVATAKGTNSTKLTQARDELRTAATEVSHATADTWDATKDRVGSAWQKADSAIRSAAE